MTENERYIAALNELCERCEIRRGDYAVMPAKLYSLSARRVAFCNEIEFLQAFVSTTDKVEKNTENVIILVGTNELKIIFSEYDYLSERFPPITKSTARVVYSDLVRAKCHIRGVYELVHKNGASLVFTLYQPFAGLMTEEKKEIRRIMKNLKYKNL